jgi:DNA polymerase elongation subunit (family B)
MQMDIETYTEPGYDFSLAERESDRILAIGLADNTGWEEVISSTEMEESALLERLVEVVRSRDPDVIEGHNIFSFDWPYLLERARRRGVRLALGRDGSEPSVRSGRFVVGERILNYPRLDLVGRSIVDTYFLAQLYDLSDRSLPGFGLKEVARHFGLSADDRVYLDGGEIAAEWRRQPERVLEYLRGDLRETRALADVLIPIYHAQAQILPFAFQDTCLRGNAAKIDALMIREYLRRGQALPMPQPPRPFEGGYTDIFFTGVARPVHHCDVRSLYPSIMVRERIAPKSDELGVFLELLDYLRTFRLDAKRRAQGAEGAEAVYLHALQSTFKILINSFYGYLGFAMARFNDFDGAERVAARGREILRQLIEAIRRHGGQPIEIDTDGVYFVPPPGADPAAIERFRDAVSRSLPEGIEIEFDGEYAAMFSYKMKNYALLTTEGEILIKGAALKSRGLEPYQRDFLRDAIALILQGEASRLEELLRSYREKIERREQPIRWLAKMERLTEDPATYRRKVEKSGRGRNAAYELALRSGRVYRAGDSISYYVTGDRKNVPIHTHARLVSDWDPAHRDENTAFYIARLEALAAKLRRYAEGGDRPTDDQEQKELEL